jgi:hypothetical protein
MLFGGRGFAEYRRGLWQKVCVTIETAADRTFRRGDGYCKFSCHKNGEVSDPKLDLLQHYPLPSTRQGDSPPHSPHFGTRTHQMIKGILVGAVATLAFHSYAKADTGEMTIGLEPPPQPAAPTSTSPRALTMEEVSTPTAAELAIGTVRSRFSLNFFGDTTLSIGSPAAPDHFLSFAFGAQDLLLKGELGNHIVATTEIAMEPDDSGIVVDIERFGVKWQSKRFFVEMGRTHTAFGYWNNAYHHGRWLQPSIDRPRWVAFEDAAGILPVHWVGIDVGTKLKAGAGTLNLFASVGNGRGVIVDDVRNARDYQSLKALHLAAEFVGIHWPELRAGVSFIIDRIPAQPMAVRPSLPDQAIDEMIVGAHVAFPSYPLVLIAEGYGVIHRAKNMLSETQQWTTFGGFVLLGYAFGRFTPYGEFESVSSRGGVDPFFVPDTMEPGIPSFDTARGIGGLRIDLSDWTALKAEYRFTRSIDTSTNFHEGLVNWCWGF